jgi:hypothetical protein
LHEVVHVSYDIETDEEWTELRVNPAIADDLFAWSPPAGWTEWRPPPPEEALLKPGASVPDFTLALADGGKTNLQQYRGKAVWMVFWRVG